MSKAALAALIAVSADAMGFVAPDPGLTRIAPDRAAPRQRPLAEGFWGAGSRLMLIVPILWTSSGGRKGDP